MTSDEKEAADSGDSAGDKDAGKTRENPLPLGSTVSTDDWDLTINSVNLDAAAEIVAADMINQEPAEGETYILVNVTATFKGDDADGSIPLASIDFVSAEGKSFDSTSKLLVAPEAFDSLSTLYKGGSTTGNIAIAVSGTDVNQGVLAVRAALLSDKVFVAVK
ncbi:DUF4352 domain-containing protein [Schaalia sp. ZJ405]|uniref:DUF4352 domain-containing protein n=1 Tax=Schaalia sp. ZJ405 TaxID=2709403 RepID=UPI001E5AA367|nr:DUF4352 domain-containing protein [Schaalia sp. ZJ405]